MAVKLLAINDVYNIREAKYIVDEENEKNLIPEEDKVQGTKVLVIKGSKEYRMDSNKNWVLIKGESGGDSSLPAVTSSDNGKVLGVVNGEWDKMTAPSGEGDFFIINGTLDEEYDSQTDTYVQVFVPDKTADEVVAAMQAGKYLVATAYNANWNETYVMNCVKQQITDSVGGAYTASAYFIGEDNTKKAAAQYLYKTQYYIKFEYQHPADGGGSEPEISWAYSNETFSVPSRGFYQADIRLSTENITPSTTYTVDASIAQIEAISKIRTSSLSITLYYSNYSNIAKNYRATNYSINGNTVYFDVIETISSSNPQITLHKFSWASNNTVTRLGSYTIPIPVLPSVTASDNGKVLGVVNGVWNKMAPSGGSTDFFFIHAVVDTNNNVTVTETDADVMAAVQANKTIVAILRTTTDAIHFFYRDASYYDSGNDYEECSLDLKRVPSIGSRSYNTEIAARNLEYSYYKSGSEEAEVSWDFYEGTTTLRLYDTVFEVNVALDNGVYTPSRRCAEAWLAIRHGNSLNLTIKEGDNSYSAIGYSTKTVNYINYIVIYAAATTAAADWSPEGLKVRAYKWEYASIGTGTFTYIGEQTIGGSSLPSVTSSDNGSVLQVNSSGAWAKGINIQEHDYTVIYDDGTTTTLKNVEVV